MHWYCADLFGHCIIVILHELLIISTNNLYTLPFLKPPHSSFIASNQKDDPIPFHFISQLFLPLMLYKPLSLSQLSTNSPSNKFLTVKSLMLKESLSWGTTHTYGALTHQKPNSSSWSLKNWYRNSICIWHFHIDALSYLKFNINRPKFK